MGVVKVKQIKVMDVTNEAVLSTLETFRDMYRDDPEYAMESLDDAISELRQGLPVVGRTK